MDCLTVSSVEEVTSGTPGSFQSSKDVPRSADDHPDTTRLRRYRREDLVYARMGAADQHDLTSRSVDDE